jgi:hypothetical protein
MCISKASVGYCSLFLCMVLLALVAGSTSARTLPAKPDAGQEPAAAPILYNLSPPEGASISRDELSRASATIETRRRASVSWAGIYIDGHLRPSTLMGPTRYQQTISTDIGDLGPGIHTVRVKAVDSEGLVGGHVWKFTVA